MLDVDQLGHVTNFKAVPGCGLTCCVSKIGHLFTHDSTTLNNDDTSRNGNNDDTSRNDTSRNNNNTKYTDYVYLWDENLFLLNVRSFSF